jgi:NADPH2:quinone reductase
MSLDASDLRGSMVKAIRVHEFGGPEALRFDEVTLAQPGPGEVLLQQHAVGLNFVDTYQRAGLYPNPLPFTPGNEAAGAVLAVGPGVDEFKPGDRVAYGTALGAYAEQRLIPAEKLVHLPDFISYESGAAMMLKGLTAEYLLHGSYKVQPGDVILVHAAAGGVGLILCQWAKAIGATVIGTVGTRDKGELARQHGADHVIYYRDEDFVAHVKDLTNGQGCHAVYDGIGKATFPGSLDCLRPLGTFVSYGAASGQIEAFNINILAQKGSLFATRPTLFTYANKRADLLRMTEHLMQIVQAGKVRIDVTARFPLSDAATAHRALEGRQTTGASVLLV